MTTTEPEKKEAPVGVPFTLNGQKLVADEGELLIDACDRNDVHIPRFCYHNRMKPVGMCRMCLVEVDTGRGPSLQPSCMLSVSPEMVVETETQVTKDAQDGVLELLLANHPLDCPVCDKGGECPLQDNAYAYGPGESRFVEEKRHFEKPIPISDLVNLDRERCILCDRCTRFASEVAGDSLIHFIDRGSQTQVNTFPDHPFASYFSGNTVQICPVGALTAEPYRFKARPWDLDTNESTSAVDASGARVLLQSSQDRLVRTLGVDSDAVNWGWLSDKERFLYEASNSEDRIGTPLVSDGSQLVPTRWHDAAASFAEALQVGSQKIGVIGGARMPLEGQYAWSKLCKGILGTDNVDSQLSDGLPAPLVLGLPRTTISEAFAPGSVVVLAAPDLKEILPSVFLRLRHAVLEDGVKLIEISQRASSLSALADVSLHVRPGAVGTVLSLLADGASSSIRDVVVASKGKIVDSSREVLQETAALLGGESPVSVILGRVNEAESMRYTSDTVAALQRLAPGASFLPALRRGNSVGALEMGLAPGFLPGGVRLSDDPFVSWPVVPGAAGLDTAGILLAASEGKIETLVLLGADPLKDFSDSVLARNALSSVQRVVAVDCFVNDSVAHASVVLPVSMFGEVDGSFVNLEGRVSPLLAKVSPVGQSRADWMIAVEVAEHLGEDLGFDSLESLRAEMSEQVSSLQELSWEQVLSEKDGVVLPSARQWGLTFADPLGAPKDTGRDLRLLLDRKLWDKGTMVAFSSSLSGLADPFSVHLSPFDSETFALDGAEKVRLWNDSGSFVVPFLIDASVPRGTVWAPSGLSATNIGTLISVTDAVSTVYVEPAASEAVDG